MRREGGENEDLSGFGVVLVPFAKMGNTKGGSKILFCYFCLVDWLGERSRREQI